MPNLRQSPERQETLKIPHEPLQSTVGYTHVPDWTVDCKISSLRVYASN